jgi:hypothetical protein
MIMAPRVRKFALTVHVISSVGWLGAIISAFALAVVGMASQDLQVVRSSYISMEFLGWAALVPFSVLSLLSGIIQSLGTTWGLVRHYWVIAKLVLNVLATTVLLLYTQTLNFLANIATQDTLSDADLALLKSPTVMIHSIGALVVLLLATVLAVYKPRGMTRYGQRKARQGQRKEPQRAPVAENAFPAS